jgi:penicillin-binding protein 2
MSPIHRGSDGGRVAGRSAESSRLRLVLLATLFAFLMLLGRCAYICFVNGPTFAAMAVSQRSSSAALPPARGDITARSGELLAHGSGQLQPGPPFTHAAVFPTAIRGSDEAIQTIEAALGHVRNGYARVVRIPPELADEVVEAGRAVVGVVPFQLTPRTVVAAQHVVGYVSRGAEGATHSGEVGVDGLEATFDWVLGSGDAGEVMLSVDGRGECMAGLGAWASHQSARGSVSTTIDLPLQQVAEAALKAAGKGTTAGAAGAVVVLDVATGQVLAMASTPTYDAQNLTGAMSSPGAPLLNRAVRPYYPGSVFKVVVAAAALEAGISAYTWEYIDEGFIDVGDNIVRCAAYERGGHGRVGMAEMLAHSCNTAAIVLAAQTGGGAVRAQAKAFGVGDPTLAGRLHLQGASSGRVAPLSDLSSEAGLANLALGQLHVEMTPVEAAAMMACIAGDGQMVIPSLVLEAEDASGRRMMYPRSLKGDRAISPGTAATLRRMLETAATEGTASAVLAGLSCAGKTGTAQTGRLDSAGSPVYNAWFAGYAPAQKPSIAVAVVLESGRSGADVAAPVFREIVQFWTRTEGAASS